MFDYVSYTESEFLRKSSDKPFYYGAMHVARYCHSKLSVRPPVRLMYRGGFGYMEGNYMNLWVFAPWSLIIGDVGKRH